MPPHTSPLILLIEGLLGVAVLGLVPLGLMLPGGDPAPRPRRLGVALGCAGVPLLIALRLRGSPAALLLGAPWLALTAALGLRRLHHLVRTGRRTLAALAHVLAFLYLPVGALWALVYVGDLALLGFGGIQALLTAIHFHYAGFGACLIAAQLGDTMPPAGGRRRLYRLAAPAMMLGIPLLALGISGSQRMEQAAALDVALALASLGALLLGRLRDPLPRLSHLLSALSGLAALCGAALALSFLGLGFANLGTATLQRMVLWHGLTNALGFVGLGFLSFAHAHAVSGHLPGPSDRARKGATHAQTHL